MATHNEVAHNWAHKTGRAQTGFNMYYTGDTIYSYGSHFPIATHSHTADGRQCVLIASRSYSVSTSKHCTYVERAIPSYYSLRFYVYNPAPRNKREHKENYQNMLKEREDSLKLASRARSRKEEHLGDADRLRYNANEYTKAFRLGYREVPAPIELEAELEAIAARQKREKDAHARKVKKEQEARDKRDKEALQAWLAGDDVRAPSNTRIPYVRVKGDEVQTTWGIRIPLPRALALYRLANHCRKCGHEYKPAHAQKVGGYPLDSIDDKGTIRAGCHIIPFRVQQEAAKLAGLARP